MVVDHQGVPMSWTHGKLARLGIVLKPEDDLTKVKVWTREGKRWLSELSEEDLREAMRAPEDPE